jgi:Tfp pilus assembly protein PilF
MSMRYLCVHCDEKFELAEEEEPRCPKCLRVHGLRPLRSSAQAGGLPAGRRPIWLVAAVLGLGALAFGAYALSKRHHEADPVVLASGPLAGDTLARELERRGAQAAGLDRLLVADDAVERFATSAVAGKREPGEKATALVAALRERAKSQAFVAWPLSEARAEPPMTAAQVQSAIAKDGARKSLYPLEVAALGVASLRAVGVQAMVVELYEIAGERAPLDPSGRLGYYAIALGATKDSARIYDVHGGRAELTGCNQCALLGDLEAIGAALALRASARMIANEDPAAALRDVDAAAKLAPSSPTVRTARSAVLLANGATDLGQSELEAAAQLRPDAARGNNLAMLHMALGEGERATQEVARALERQPDFALARVTLAQIHLARGERDLARSELEKAEALDPKLPLLPLTWAEFHASAGENDQAIEYARRAVEQKPRDAQVRLLLARIYRQASRYEEMRIEARAALALAPTALAGRMHELIERMLGPTALQLDVNDPGEPDPGDSPGLLQPDSKPSKLRLTEPGTSLKLDPP